MNFVNGILIATLPLVLGGIATIVVQVFDIKACMGRLEERLKNHIQYHESERKERRRN